jgi:hypothetical protein
MARTQGGVGWAVETGRGVSCVSEVTVDEGEGSVLFGELRERRSSVVDSNLVVCWDATFLVDRGSSDGRWAGGSNNSWDDVDIVWDD